MKKEKSSRVDHRYKRLKDLNKHTVAHFFSAYVYGNILILAALIAITPEDIEHGHGAPVVLGTGLATLLAHVVAESQEILVLRKPEEQNREDFVRSLSAAFKDSRPILSATIFPASMLFLAQWGLLAAGVAWWASVMIIITRMARNGTVITKYRGEKVTGKTILLNLIFTAVCALVAVIKVVLTH